MGRAARRWKRLRSHYEVVVWWLCVIINNWNIIHFFFLTLLQLLTDTKQRLALSPQFDSGICFILITSKPQSTPVQSEPFLNLLSCVYALSFIPNKRKQAKATPSRRELSLPLSRVPNRFLPFPHKLVSLKTLWIKTPDVPRHCSHFQPERTQVWASVGAFDDGVLAGIVQDWAFGKRDVRCDASDWYSETNDKKNTWVNRYYGLDLIGDRTTNTCCFYTKTRKKGEAHSCKD